MKLLLRGKSAIVVVRFLCTAFMVVGGPMFATRGAGGAESAAPVSAEQAEYFEKHVRPLLITHCASCHGEKKAEAGLRVDTRAGFFHGIEGVSIVSAKEPEKSRLIQVTRYDGDVQMPPDGKIPEAAFAVLLNWVKMGTPWPEDKGNGKAGETTIDPAVRIASARASHWAYQPIKQSALPDVRDAEWTRTRLDRFVLETLEKNGLTPSPAADRFTMLRRVTFDLIGLPPTAEQADDFVSDDRPDALSRVVDRLLASPQYGERWGRHWLDIARYADTKGYAFQQERRYPYAYTYRDYVVQSFNQDLPFDQFVKEQIAADLLPPRDENRSLAALGFLTVGRRFNNVHDDIDDRIDVVTRGLLGLTVACARCHDHKFDAIPADDYYSLYGVFRNTEEPKESPLIGSPAQSREYEAYKKELDIRQKALNDFLNDANSKLTEHLRTQVGDFLAQMVIDRRGAAAANGYKFAKRELRPTQVARWRDFIAKSDSTTHSIWGLWNRFEKLDDKTFGEEAAKIVASLQDEAQAKQVNRLVREAFQKADVKRMIDVAATYGAVLDGVKKEWQAVVALGKEKSQKEKKPAVVKLEDPAAEELRQVLYSKSSPPMFDASQAKSLYEPGVTARLRNVQKKVDEWTVTSPAAPPRAMALVDAAKPVEPVVFIRGNPERRGKQVPRQFLGVLSGDSRKPFQKGSGRLELAESIADPSNPLTSRVFMNRLWQHHFGAGVVRTPSNYGERGDAPTHLELLDELATRFVADEWSVKRQHREILLSATFGQSSRLNPKGVKADPENRWLWRMNRRRLEFEPNRDAMLFVANQLNAQVGGRPVSLTSSPFTTRRTLYGTIDRQDLPALFHTFDFASPDVSTEQRPETTVPQQALFAMNSPFVIEQAKKLAACAGQKVDQLYRLTLGRNPQTDELEFAQRFLNVSDTHQEIETIWKYGQGEIDLESERLVNFKPLAHWTGSAWQVGDKFPHGKAGHLMLRAGGGHPGNGPLYVAVLRWVAPRDGVYSVSGLLEHPHPEGDGVRARLIFQREGKIATWIAAHGKTKTEFSPVKIRKGEVLDFVVDARATTLFDSYKWSPVVKMIEPSSGPVWDAAKEFHGPAVAGMSPWEMLAQVLLLTNEFTFVD